MNNLYTLNKQRDFIIGVIGIVSWRLNYADLQDFEIVGVRRLFVTREPQKEIARATMWRLRMKWLRYLGGARQPVRMLNTTYTMYAKTWCNHK